LKFIKILILIIVLTFLGIETGFSKNLNKEIKRSEVNEISHQLINVLKIIKSIGKRRPNCRGTPSEPNLEFYSQEAFNKSVIIEKCDFLNSSVFLFIQKNNLYYSQLENMDIMPDLSLFDSLPLPSEDTSPEKLAPEEICARQIDDLNSFSEYKINEKLKESLEGRALTLKDETQLKFEINTVTANLHLANEAYTKALQTASANDPQNETRRKLIAENNEKIKYYTQTKLALESLSPMPEVKVGSTSPEDLHEKQLKKIENAATQSTDSPMLERVTIHADGTKTKVLSAPNETLFMGREVLFSRGNNVTEAEAREHIILMAHAANVVLEKRLVDQFAKKFAREGIVVIDQAEAETILGLKKNFNQATAEIKFSAEVVKKFLKIKYARMFDHYELAKISEETHPDDYAKAHPQNFSWFALGGGVWGHVKVVGEKWSKVLVEKPPWWAKHFEKMGENVRPLPEEYHGLAEMSVPQRNILEDMGFDSSKIFSPDRFPSYQLPPKTLDQAKASRQQTATPTTAASAAVASNASGNSASTSASTSSAPTGTANNQTSTSPQRSPASHSHDSSEANDSQTLPEASHYKSQKKKTEPMELSYFTWVYNNRYQPVSDPIEYQKGLLLKKEVVFDLAKSQTGKETGELTAVALEITALKQNYFYLKMNRQKIMLLYDSKQHRFRPEFNGMKDRKFWQQIKDHPFCQNLTYLPQNPPR
jgi:hypothetical protein